jgi:hypothetical protein
VNHVARHLQDILREGVLEAQLVRTGGVIDREFARVDHRFPAIL